MKLEVTGQGRMGPPAVWAPLAVAVLRLGRVLFWLLPIGRLANAGVVMQFLESCSLSDVLRLAPALLQDGSTQGRAAAHLLVRLRECVDDCVEAYSAIIRLIHTYYSPEPAFCVEFIRLLDETMFPASVVSSLSHMIVEPLPHAQLQRLVNKLGQLAANDRALLVPTIGALGELPLTADLRDQVRAQA